MQAETTLENPLRAGTRLERTAEPCAVVIFGASGDLAKRKLIPALYRLVQERLVPAEFAVVGAARTEMSHDDFRAKMREGVSQFAEGGLGDGMVWESFAQKLYYCPVNTATPEHFQNLGALLQQIDSERGTQGNRLFYLSTSPTLYSEAVAQLGRAGLAKSERGWVRVIIEKPFGTDL